MAEEDIAVWRSRHLHRRDDDGRVHHQTFSDACPVCGGERAIATAQMAAGASRLGLVCSNCGHANAI